MMVHGLPLIAVNCHIKRELMIKKFEMYDYLFHPKTWEDKLKIAFELAGCGEMRSKRGIKKYKAFFDKFSHLKPRQLAEIIETLHIDDVSSTMTMPKHKN